MADTPPIWQNRETIWRVARLWLVVLALGMAAIGILFALQQAKSFTQRIRQEAEAQAARVAQDARGRFDQQLQAFMKQAARAVAQGRIDTWLATSRMPGWADGVFTWDGAHLLVLVPPSETGDKLESLLVLTQGRLDLLPLDTATQLEDPAPDLLYDRLDGDPFVLAQVPTAVSSGRLVSVAVRISVPRQRTALIEPLLPAGSGLEVVRVRPRSKVWSVPLSGALRFWAIKPTEAFVSTQRNTVLRQTLICLCLTVLSLVTLLVAMWFLVRVARHEVALAKLKANFVADVSHELKTPLALIRMFGETLQDGRVATEEKRQEYYEIITREATRLTNLINNILDFARIEAGRKEYILRPTDIVAVVRQTYHTYASQLDHANFEHHYSEEPNLPMVDADPDAISQAVLNLISNAQKYSQDERYIAIDVTKDTRRGHAGVLISVHDRGIGIRPEDRARLVEGFFRADDDRVRERSGTGLGLSLVRHIVQAHGGSVHVESRLVKGSTFRIFLPESVENIGLQSEPGDRPEVTDDPGRPTEHSG